MVGERSLPQRSRFERGGGVERSEDAGMSNDKTGESPVRRNSQGS